MKQLLFLLLLCVSSSSFAGKVYKWTDENGQVHYSTFPPARAETEKVRVPASTNDNPASSSKKRKYKKNEKRYLEKKAREKKRAAEAYERKYGAEARLKRLETEKREKDARSEQIRRERIRKLEQAQKDKEFEEKWKGFKDRLLGLKDECEAAHGTDCGNPEYLKSWLKKKYEPKK